MLLTENKHVKSLFLLYTASIYSNFVALFKTYISRGQTDIFSSATLSGSDFLSLLSPELPGTSVSAEQAGMAGRHIGKFPLPRTFSVAIYFKV